MIVNNTYVTVIMKKGDFLIPAIPPPMQVPDFVLYTNVLRHYMALNRLLYYI